MRASEPKPPSTIRRVHHGVPGLQFLTGLSAGQNYHRHNSRASWNWHRTQRSWRAQRSRDFDQRSQSIKRLGSCPAPAGRPRGRRGAEARPGPQFRGVRPRASSIHRAALCAADPPNPGSWVTPLMTFQGGPGGNHLLEVGGSVSVPCQLYPGLYEASSTRNPPEPFSVQCGLADGIFFFFFFICVCAISF